MNDSQITKEYTVKGGHRIHDYIRQFSATEKVFFGVLVIVAVVTALVMVAKVNSYFMTEVPSNGGSLNEGVVGLPRTINPVLAVTDIDRDLSSLIYSGLLKYEDGTLVPDLAKSYKVSDDGLTYSFILKDSLKFQDGSNLTSEDIVFTIQKIQNPAFKSPRGADFANVSVHASSTKEVSFVLKQPYSLFLNNFTIGILPKHIWGEISDDQFIFSKYNTEPIGSGPYKINSISRDSDNIPSQYKLKTWRNYAGKTPYLTTIIFTFFGDEESALTALKRGSIDSLAAISPKEANELNANSASKHTILSSTLPRIFGVFFNQNQNPILADKVVRQALNMSADKEKIVEEVLNGYGKVLSLPFPDLSTNSPKIESKSTSTAIASAQALLEKNGWKKNTDTGIYELQKKGSKNVQVLAFDIFTADTPDLKQTATIIKGNWTELGAKVDIKIFETSDLYQNIIRTRKYDALLFGELIGKDRDVYAFWHSSQRLSPGLNVAMYTNSKVDKLLENIRIEKDEKTRINQYAELNKLITEDIPAIFLYSPDFIYVIKDSIKGIDLGSITVRTDRWNNINDWYITTEKVWNFFVKK